MFMEHYWLVTTIISFWMLVSLRSQMEFQRNLIGSVLLSALLGWLLWPLLIWTLHKKSL